MVQFKIAAGLFLFFLFFALSPNNGQAQRYFPQQDKIVQELNTDVKMQFEKDLILRNAQLDKVHSINGIAEDWSLIPDFGIVPADDRATAMAVDQNNNTYLAGYSTTAGYGLDVSLVKYDAAGQQLWAIKYDSPSGKEDKPVSVFTGNDGAVYVAGNSYNTYNQADIFLIKFNSAGKLIWEKQYDTLGDLLIKTRMTENQCIIFGVQNLNGLQTSKLDTSGLVLWTDFYESDGSSGNYYDALVVDNTGNVYAADLIRSPDFSPVLAILKYDADGLLLWTSLFLDVDAGFCFASDLTLDRKGSSLVCGRNNNSDKMVLTKIDSSGSLLWSAVYTDPFLDYVQGQKVVVDGNGSTYALGTCRTYKNRTSLLVKYDAQGNQLWVKQFDDSNYNRSYIAVLDTGAAVYTAGYIKKGQTLFAVKKFDLEGQKIWSDEYLKPGFNSGSPASARLTADGSLLICGTGTEDGAGSDMALLRYDSSGVLEWDAYFNSGLSSSNSSSGKLAAANDGSVFLLGYNSAQFHLFKYTNTGQTVWEKTYPQTPATSVYSGPLEFSTEQDAVYLTAEINGDDMLFKYKTSRELEWSQTIPCLSNLMMSGVSKKGAVSVCGIDYCSDSIQDAVRINCYDENGNLSWSSVYQLAKTGNMHVNDIKMDSAGRVYVLLEEWIWDEQNSSSQYRLNAYDTDGTEMWSRLVIDPGYGYFSQLILDDWDNVFAAGQVYDTVSHRSHAEIKKIKNSGKVDWTAVYNNTDLSISRGYTTTADIFGNIYFAGSGWNYALNEYSRFVIKWDRNGQLLWKRFIDETMGSFFPNRLTTDRLGNLYVSGSTKTSKDGWDVTVVKFDPDGNFKWQSISGAGLNGWDWFRDMALNSRGEIFVTASSETASSQGQHFISLFKYGQTGQDSLAYALPEQFSLAQNAPNPFNNQTLLRFSLKRETEVKISVFNNAGQCVYVKNLGLLQQGDHNFHFSGARLASGVYFYRIEAGASSKTKKMVLVH